MKDFLRVLVDCLPIFAVCAIIFVIYYYVLRWML